MFTMFTGGFVAQNERSVCFHCASKEIKAALIALMRNLNEAGLLPDDYLMRELTALADTALNTAWEKACQEELQGLPQEKQVELSKHYLEKLTVSLNELIETLQEKGAISKRLHS
jgi:hypothetical protein